MSGVRVCRLTGADDLSAAIVLLQRFFAEEGFDTPPEAISANARRLASIETCGLFIAEFQNEAVGVATISMEFGIEYGWSAEMGDLYVLPPWRGRGISRAIVGAVEDFLRSKEATCYQVTVTPYAREHHGLTAFYESLGFAPEGRLILCKHLGTRG